MMSSSSKLFTVRLFAIALIMLPVMVLSAQEELSDDIEFTAEVIAFDDYPGLTARLSKPFLSYQTWDTEHTGDSRFAVALEITNDTGLAISAINFRITAYDGGGEISYQGTAGTGPMTFEPQDGAVMRPGYTGVYAGFFTRDRGFADSFARLDVDISEVKTVESAAATGPVFSDEWLTFEEFPGLQFQLSEPYRFLDDLSGNERFAIALRFRNDSGKPVRSMNFFVRVFDDSGPLHELETQEHNQKFDPAPRNFFAADFPADYEGVDASFYRNDLSLFSVFSKIEIVLMSVE